MGKRGMRKIAAIIGLALTLSVPGYLVVLDITTPRIEVSEQDLLAHRISGEQVVKVPELLEYGHPSVTITVEVDRDGSVRSASVGRFDGIFGLNYGLAVHAARHWKFRPFIKDGKPVKATGRIKIGYRGKEIWADPNAPFPEIDFNNLEINLFRSSCDGTCPAYDVKIDGKGVVTFHAMTVEDYAANIQERGKPLNKYHGYFAGGVLAPGIHVTRISRSEVERLVKKFQAARFFGLSDEYISTIPDFPDFTLSFRTGKNKKTVLDYGGLAAGMPKAVKELQDEVDRVANAKRWIEGDGETIKSLETEGFDFRSPTAQLMLADAVAIAPDSFVFDLLDRGVPLEAKVSDHTDVFPLGEFLVMQAAQNGRIAVFNKLAEMGWLRRLSKKGAERALLTGCGCNAEIAERLIKAGADPAARDGYDRTALMIAAALSHDDCGNPANKQTLIRTLVRLGVPINASDRKGETALFRANDLVTIKSLLAAGADPNIRSKNGDWAVLDQGDDEVIFAMLRAGANPHVSNTYYRSIRHKAELSDLRRTLEWLDKHGIE